MALFPRKTRRLRNLEYPINCLYSQKIFGSLTGTAVEPVEPAPLGDSPTNEQHESHRVATEEFENIRKRFRDEYYSVWCVLVSNPGSTSLMLIWHDGVRKDGLGDGTRAWNLLKEIFRSEESPTVMALVPQIPKAQLEPDEALHQNFIRAQELTTRLSDAGERVSWR